MGLISWLTGLFRGETVKANGDGWADDPRLIELYTDASYRELARWTAIDLIARAISKCEVREYRDGREVRAAEWYRWNVEPNKNQNSSTFWRKLVSALYCRGECLVIEHSGQLLVADGFERSEYVLYPDVFSNVTIGSFTFSNTFPGDEVLYWNLDGLGDGSLRGALDASSESYAKLLAYAMKSYKKSRGTKATLNIEALPMGLTQDQMPEYIKKQMDNIGRFLSADGGVYPQYKGVEIGEFGSGKTYSNESTRDIRSLIDDISDFTAKAYGIPPALLRGDVQGTSDAMDHFLTFCIDPLVGMLQEEIVRKVVGRAGVERGDNLIIDTRAIKHIDVLEVSGKIEKLIGSGVFCVNDIRKLLGEPIIDEPWAWRFFMTKNFSTAESLLTEPGGGE